jgi:Family of unknown function (DUF5758)/Pentapeptide repeats (8 copies)
MLINGKEFNISRGADLSGADLSGAYLSYADLSGAYLIGSNLSGAYLSYADLRNANLRNAYLRNANLRNAYLSGADLRNAYLSGADLRNAYLSGADLSGADLSGADLSGANLSGAYLIGSDLSGADLSGAYLRNAKNIHKLVVAQTSIVASGDIIGWKKISGMVICKLLIPADAKRSNATGRKCRASFAIVLEGEGVSLYDSKFKYRVGERVEPREPFDENRWEECASGIHFFITREEAENFW